MIERFELELLGGATERRFRRMRPEIEALPWDSFDVAAYPEDVRLDARVAWTSASFQEHRTGAACSIALHAMIDARVPLDLIALATRFPLDEMVHVELCARMAMALGGGTEILYEPHETFFEPSRDQAPLRRAAEAIVGTFCVGEALSIPLLRGSAKSATHPLPRAVLSRIVRDEAAHGAYGFTFLDWASPDLDDADRQHLARVAAKTIAIIEATWSAMRNGGSIARSGAHVLARMQTSDYLTLAERSMRDRVIAPLQARGIDPTRHLDAAREEIAAG